MARQKMTGEARIYKYGASAPTLNFELIEEQLSLVHRYRNKLVELELNRRAEVDAAVAALAPDLGPTESALEEIDKEIVDSVAAQKAINIKQRGRKVDKASRDAIRALRAARKELYQTRKQLRKNVFGSDVWKTQQLQIEAVATTLGKQARADCGLYWGSYGPVEEAARAFRKGSPPRFARWTGEGKLAVQIQQMKDATPFKPAQLYSCEDTKLRLEQFPNGVWTQGKNRPKKLGNAVLSFRIGSLGKGNRIPVWGEIPISFHRPLPPSSTIKWVYIMRRKRATKTIWSVCFVLQGEHGAFDIPDRASEGKVGIDVGWRKFNDRIRIAVYSGSDGQEGELCLPGWWLGEMRRVERIRGHRDELMDTAKAELKVWLKGQEGLPDWMVEVGNHVHQWRSAARLAGFCLRWRKEAENGTQSAADALAKLEAWRYRDKHLFEYEAHLRSQLQASRKDLYRKFAANLSRRYAVAHIEDLDLRKFHKLASIEDGGDKGTDAITNYVRDACLSSLFDALKGRMVRTEKTNPADTTRQCHACRVIDVAWTDHAKVNHECSSCGVTWDQDTNAARNLLLMSGDPMTFRRPALAPVVRHTYNRKGQNRARRRVQKRRALEMRPITDAA